MFWAVAKALRGGVDLRRKMRGPLRPSWGLTYETLAIVLHHWAKRSIRFPLGVQRKAAEGFFTKSDITRSTQYERVQVGSAAAEWFRYDGADPDRVLMYLHGGGYSIGSIDTHRDFIGRLIRACGVTGFALDYRLAPEHRYPAQLDDAVAAYRWLIHDQGVDPRRVIIAGESAGGGLTVSTLIALLAADEPLPACAVVISPWVDLESLGDSMNTNAPFDYVSRAVLDVYARRFVLTHQLRDPLAAPMYADLTGLPPLLIHAGGAEVLLDDAKRLAERATEGGVDVTLEIYADMIHAWHVFRALLPEAQAAIDDIATFVSEHVAT